MSGVKASDLGLTELEYTLYKESKDKLDSIYIVPVLIYLSAFIGVLFVGFLVPDKLIPLCLIALFCFIVFISHIVNYKSVMRKFVYSYCKDPCVENQYILHIAPKGKETDILEYTVTYFEQGEV